MRVHPTGSTKPSVRYAADVAPLPVLGLDAFGRKKPFMNPEVQQDPRFENLRENLFPLNRGLERRA